jgi:hypothetical protein
VHTGEEGFWLLLDTLPYLNFLESKHYLCTFFFEILKSRQNDSYLTVSHSCILDSFFNVSYMLVLMFQRAGLIMEERSCDGTKRESMRPGLALELIGASRISNYFLSLGFFLC